jgi:hypothetical protein
VGILIAALAFASSRVRHETIAKLTVAGGRSESRVVQIKVALTFLIAVLIAACAAPTAVIHDIDANVPCPEWTNGQLGLAVSVVPIAVPGTLIVSEGAVPGYGIQARRISIAVKPPRAAASVRLIASTLSINILGGNFRNWANPADQFADTGAGSKVAHAVSQPRTVSSTQAFEATPGRVRVSPFLGGNRLHAQTQALDVAIVPGGAPVDQPVVVTSSLWDKDKRPIAPAQLNIELSSLRLSSIYETVEATIDLDYEISSANGSVAWSCSATSHEVLVDRDAIRPALWDVGVPLKFGASRKRWLALYSPAIGAVRAVFTTPEGASAFAAWLQQVGGAAAGKYSLGLFTPANPNEKGRILPFDSSIMDTFQSISADEIALLKAGEIDKP